MKVSVNVGNCVVEREDPRGGTAEVCVTVASETLVLNEMEFRNLVRAVASFQLALRSSPQNLEVPSP